MIDRIRRLVLLQKVTSALLRFRIKPDLHKGTHSAIASASIISMAFFCHPESCATNSVLYLGAKESSLTAWSLRN